jgi:YD repeat-containing protein
LFLGLDINFKQRKQKIYMAKNFKIILYLLIQIISSSVFSQNSNVKNPFLPNYTVPTPQSAGLGRYGEIPISPATGIPDINIPLGSAKGNKLEVPIRLIYHASGIKVDDLAGWVGQGWSLDAGGLITRTIVGQPDEYNRKNFICNFCSIQNLYLKSSYDIRNNNDDYSYLKKLADGQLDGEPDIFAFNFLGKTGKFFIDTSGTIITDKKYPYKIESLGFSDGGAFIRWKITDENGIKYYFDGSTGGGIERIRMKNSPQSSLPPYGDISPPQTTAWYLNKIIYPGNADSIVFTYSDYSPSNFNSPIHKYKTNYTSYIPSGNVSVGSDFDLYEILKGTIDGEATLTEEFPKQIMMSSNILVSTIKSKNGEVDFFSHSLTTGYFDRYTDYKLDSISFKDNNNNVTKKYQLFYSYKNERLFLDSLKEKSLSASVPPYIFTYYGNLPKRFSYSQDYWGYYNGKSNSHLIPYIKELMYKVRPYPLNNGLESYTGYTPADRTADELSAKAGTISKIKYPTGGYTQFDYELNEFTTINQNLDLESLGLPPNATMKGAGIRIKTIEDFDGINSTSFNKRSYEYPAGGVLQHVPQYLSVARENNYYLTTTYSDCLNSGGGLSCNICANIDTYSTLIYTGYSTPQNLFGITDITNVSYSQVKENFYKNTVIDGYKEYQFDQSSDVDNTIIVMGSTFSYPLNTLSQAIPKTGLSYSRGNLINENSYVKNGAGFLLKHSKHNVYDYNENTTSPRYKEINAVRAVRLNTVDYRYTQSSTYFGEVPSTACYINVRGSDYGYGFYNIKCATPTLATSQETFYDDSGTPTLTETTNYYYQNNSHTFPTKVEFTNSKSELMVTTMKYPIDYTDAVSQKMVTNNIISPIIQTDKLNGSTQLETIHNTYFEWLPGFFDKINILHAYKNATADAEVTFDVYDNAGNLVQFTTKSGVITTLLYGYNKQYLVAKIIGASYSQVMTQLALTGTTSNEKYETLQSLTNDISLRSRLGVLRNIPGSLVNIYTYTQMIGISSSTDEAGKVTYYNYDDLGRLILIRDDNKNVLKKYNYNYQGQTPNYNIYLQSVAKSGTYTKVCGAGFTGSSVTYTVPAGTYSSTLSIADADAKAQADVTANGQNYANDMGTCTATSNVTIKGYNSKSTDYKIKLVNNSTSAIYYFNLPTGTSVAQTLGTVPAGTYTISFLPNPSPVPSATFNINGFVYSGGSTATFNNISITATSTASMY